MSHIPYTMVTLSVSKSAFFTFCLRADFRVCSAVRVRFKQDLVNFTSYTYTHRVQSHIHWTLITKLGAGVSVTAQFYQSGDYMVTGLIFSYGTESHTVICIDVQPL